MPDYGNVPQEDVVAIQSAVRMALRVCGQMPSAAPAEWRETAYQAVLDGILADWVTNGTTELDEGDEEDLTNLLRASADAALLQEPALRDTTFKTVLKHAMRDWVENWNADE